MSVLIKELAEALKASGVKEITPSGDINDSVPPFYRFREKGKYIETFAIAPNGKRKRRKLDISSMFIKYPGSVIEVFFNGGFVYESAKGTNGFLRYYIESLESYGGEELMKEKPVCTTGFVISATDDSSKLRTVENALKKCGNRLYVFLINERRWKIV